MVATALSAALALVAPLWGCGGGGEGGAEKPPPVAMPEDFPKPAGRTLAELRKRYGAGPVLLPSVSQLEAGKNRFGFGLFDRANAQIADTAVALYVAPTRGGNADGPFLGRYESLNVGPRFQSRTVASDLDRARSVYVSKLKFSRPGNYEVFGLVRLDNRLVGATSPGGALKVVKDSRVPEVGDRPPRIQTPTKASAGGDLARIDTRVPPGTMHDEDFADVVGKKPVVLLFATPALCQSRVCGPVVDIAEQVKAKTGGDGVAWIHMEIYRDNETDKGFRPQVLKWRLPTEPWLFTIDKKGRIAARIEGAFSARELEAAVKAATKG